MTTQSLSIAGSIFLLVEVHIHRKVHVLAPIQACGLPDNKQDPADEASDEEQP